MRLRLPTVFVLIAAMSFGACAFLEKASEVIVEEGTTATSAGVGALIGGPWGAFLGAIVGSLGYQLVEKSVDVDGLQSDNQSLREQLAGLGHEFEKAGFFAKWWRWILGGGGVALIWSLFLRSPLERFRQPIKAHAKKIKAEVEETASRLLGKAFTRDS